MELTTKAEPVFSEFKYFSGFCVSSFSALGGPRKSSINFIRISKHISTRLSFDSGKISTLFEAETRAMAEFKIVVVLAW